MTREPTSSPLPEAYRAWRASELGRITDRLEERLLLDLVGNVEHERALDVGCGDGVLAMLLAERGAEVVGVDTDPRMLSEARERAKVRANVTFLEGDALDLPFPDEAFDVVIAVTVLCFVPDAERAAREMARVLRPGGRLVVGELGRWSLWAARRRIAGWLGSGTWRQAIFRSPVELRKIVGSAGLDVTAARGAVYYPPCSSCARRLAGLDPWLGRRTLIGAAFVALAATKRVHGGPRK